MHGQINAYTVRRNGVTRHIQTITSASQEQQQQKETRHRGGEQAEQVGGLTVPTGHTHNARNEQEKTMLRETVESVAHI